jgi:hypothetical protein
MWKISDRVDGARVAPAMPSSARLAIQHLGAGRERSQDRHQAEGAGPDEQQPAAADAVAQGAHGDERSGDEEPVDVDDPQQLGAGRLQVGADGGKGQVQHGQVHHIQHTGQRQHGQPDPLAPAGPWCSLDRRHLVGLLTVDRRNAA